MLIIGCDFHPSGQQVFGMVARKLAVRMCWMLKTKTQYPEVVRMQGSSSHPLGKAPSACVSTLPPQAVR